MATLIKYGFIKQNVNDETEDVRYEYKYSSVLNLMYSSLFFKIVFNHFGSDALILVDVIFKNGTLTVENLVETIRDSIPKDEKSIADIYIAWEELIHKNVVVRVKDFSKDDKNASNDIPHISNYLFSETEEVGSKRHVE